MTRVFTCLAVCAGAAFANAQVLTYTETTDFSDESFAPTIIAQPLGNGLNTISGTITGSFDGDNDYFEVTLPSDLTITEIELVVANYTPADATIGNFELLSPNSGGFTFDSDGTYDVTAALVDPSTLTFHVGSTGVLSSPAYEYTVRINAVPEPSTMLLLSAGIAAMACKRRRRKDSPC